MTTIAERGRNTKPFPLSTVLWSFLAIGTALGVGAFVWHDLATDSESLDKMAKLNDQSDLYRVIRDNERSLDPDQFPAGGDGRRPGQ